MPRFFFDTYDGNSFIDDNVGQEFESLAAAKAEAQRSLPDIARDSLPDGNHRTFVIRVRNEAGVVIVRMSLSLVVEEGAVDD